MASAPVVAGPAQMIPLHGQGRLSIAPNLGAPLLVVFGGINVDIDGRKNVPSGDYMWNYMQNLRNRFHIFVAADSGWQGNERYDLLMRTLDKKHIKPPSQTLYLFSGGYSPGMNLLRSKGAQRFVEILLVDIWMGGPPKYSADVPEFYKSLAAANAQKMTYTYTEFGANNHVARDYIANVLGPTRTTLVTKQGQESGGATHMRTNTFAVAELI